MRKLSLIITCLLASAAFAQTNNTKDPTWWDKYQYILNNGTLLGRRAATFDDTRGAFPAVELPRRRALGPRSLGGGR